MQELYSPDSSRLCLIMLKIPKAFGRILTHISNAGEGLLILFVVSRTADESAQHEATRCPAP